MEVWCDGCGERIANDMPPYVRSATTTLPMRDACSLKCCEKIAASDKLADEARAKIAEVDCWKCAEGINVGGFPLAMQRMFLCPTCGNKRCPKATDHTLACSGSNEPGQEGSNYR